MKSLYLRHYVVSQSSVKFCAFPRPCQTASLTLEEKGVASFILSLRNWYFAIWIGSLIPFSLLCYLILIMTRLPVIYQWIWKVTMGLVVSEWDNWPRVNINSVLQLSVKGYFTHLHSLTAVILYSNIFIYRQTNHVDDCITQTSSFEKTVTPRSRWMEATMIPCKLENLKKKLGDATALQVFETLFDDSIQAYSNYLTDTNRYTSQKNDLSFIFIIETEMKAFVGIILLPGYNRLPSQDY